MTDRIPGLPPPDRPRLPAVVTIGSFDGVHRGHRALLAVLRREAARRDAVPLALTFDPHPRCVVSPRCPPMLTDLTERLSLLRDAGAERVEVIRFDLALSRWSAERFLAALAGFVELRALVAGPGFALGHRREGGLDFIRRYGRRAGFEVVAARPALHRGEPISSTRVRTAVQDGRPGEAAALLGRHYTLSGEVVPGRGAGRRLGFPTANLRIAPARCLPGTGIYATRVLVEGRWLPAAASVGRNPTFDAGDLTVEQHLIDFDGDLYGRRLTVAFVRRLRSERRFAGERELSDQIARDVERSRRILG